MKLSVFRKSSKFISTVLLLNFTTELLFPLKAVATNNSVSSNGTPVAASLSSMVDGYTGDFRYSVPLVTVPGPNGENVSVSANYHAGITMNQKASWIGLGWDYNPGEITRQVIDAPDDFNGRLVLENNKSVWKFGSLYNNNINTNINIGSGALKSADIKSVYRSLSSADRCQMIGALPGSLGCQNEQSFNQDANSNYRFKRMTAPHYSLAYDQYSVSGPLSGQMKPYYLGQMDIHLGDYPSILTTGFSLNNNKKANFYFENSTTANIGITPGNGSYTDPTLVNQFTNQIHSGTRVRFFTNNEINNNSNLFNNSNGVGFLEYKPTSTSATRRAEDGDLIGAFQITDPSGVTYHYSLPVYAFDDLNWSKSQANAYNSTKFKYSMIKFKYANSWKLTAITGPDYQDLNNNYTPDEGDSGYWVAYNYSKWTDDFFWSSQPFGHRTDYSIATRFLSFVNSGAVTNLYERLNSCYNGHTETYYLNYIQTSTHTAFFVKSIRKDEQSYQKHPTSSTLSKPLLKLDCIVLLKNEFKSFLLNNIMLSGNDIVSGFNYSGCNNSDVNFVNTTRYNANKNLIDAVALKTVQFDYNYSLCRKYANNINNYFVYNPAADYISQNLLFDQNVYGSNQLSYVKNFSSTTDYNNSGKLTLKKINYFDLNGQKLTPSTDFYYDENNSVKNPDYNENKTDLWGYYKKDYVNSHYVTNISKEDVDAWSLKEINTSLGGSIKIQYESDIYNREGFLGEPDFVPVHENKYYPTPDPTNNSVSLNIPHLIFPLKSFSENPIGSNMYGYINYEMEDADYLSFIENANPLCPVPANFKIGSFRVYNYIDHCGYNQVTFNNGNSHYYPPPINKLVRYGDGGLYNLGCSGAQLASYNTSFSNQSPPNKKEFDLLFQCSATNGFHQHNKSYISGNDYEVFFRSYMYGGGVRVKQIEIVEPFKNDSYVQKFTYGEGYCPIVPKSMTLANSSGVSVYDLVMNSKTMIGNAGGSRVGYDWMSQVSVSQNGETNGSIKQEFFNQLISNPVDIVGKAISRTNVLASSQNPQYVSGCDIGFFPNSTRTIPFYNITINLKTTSAQSCLLGNILKTITYDKIGTELSSTNYSYTTKFILERFKHNTTAHDEFPITIVSQVPINHQQGLTNCKEVAHSVKALDSYYYNFSDCYTYNSFLSGTSTTKDGITISENIVERDIYTTAPKKTLISDPTQGSFTKLNTYAYSNNPSMYPSFGLKTSNENNKNLLSLVENSKTIKNNKYVVGESYVTYSNSYPTRIYDAVSNKYVTSNISHPWYRLNETFVRTLDADVLTTVSPQSSNYRKTSEGTLYDKENNRIEEKGLNDRKSASKWGYNNLYKLADISNANYNSFTFTGFEDQLTVASGINHYGGEVTNGNSRVNTATENYSSTNILVKPHTGFYMTKLSGNASGPSYYTEDFEIGRYYTAKVWVHKSSSSSATLKVQLTGSRGANNTHVNIVNSVSKSDPNNVAVGDWILMSVDINVPDDFNTGIQQYLQVSLTNSNGNSYFDDLSFHPKDAVLTGNVYNVNTGQLIAQLDNENFATLYNYDNAGRMISSYKEYSGGIKKITESQYHFAKP